MGFYPRSETIFREEYEKAMEKLRSCFGNKSIPLVEQKRRFENINKSKQIILEQDIKDSKERIVSLIDNVNKQDFSEQKEINLEEDIKFFSNKLLFGE